MPEQEATVCLRACGHLAVVEPDPLADPDEAVAAAVTVPGAPAVVAYLDAQLIGRVVQRYLGFGCLCVLEHVGEAFLDDPVGGDVDPARQGELLTGNAQPHGQPGTPELFQQSVKTVEAWLRRELNAAVVLAHGIQQVPHVRQCGTARLLHIPQHVLVLLVRVWQLVAHGADLQDHDADGVGDGVMQLARDPASLVGRRGARGGLALVFGVDRALFRDFGVPSALAQGVARCPGDREHDRNEDEFAALVVRLVVDDYHRAAQHQREAQARLEAVRDVSQQERGDVRGEKSADRGDDKPSVGEGERGRQQPHRGRSVEREAAAAEQGQDDQRDLRHGDPCRVRLVLITVPERDLDRAPHGQDHDEDLECEPARQQSQAFHATNGNPTPPRAPPT